jgi:hypothetical protein
LAVEYPGEAQLYSLRTVCKFENKSWRESSAVRRPESPPHVFVSRVLFFVFHSQFPFRLLLVSVIAALLLLLLLLLLEYHIEKKSTNMGGGNAQKSAIARERNAKNAGKSDEERKAANAKATKDATAFACKICRSTFMVNVTPPILYLHVTSKHPAGTNPTDCFDQLAGFDPDDPKGLKKAAVAAPVVAAKPKKKKKEEGLEDLLSAGLGKGKKKK